MATTVPKQLAEKFFRREYAKMVAALVKFMGPGQLALAEDMVQETLLEAMKDWEYQGIPDHPQSWLYKVARNKTLNHLKQVSNRRQLRHKYLESDREFWPETDFDKSFADDQLTMMFVCCHPALPHAAQITLILKTLGGLSIQEIAKAFLTSTEAINKRLVRARKVLREHGINFELPASDLCQERLRTVLKTLLLLFNEGYSATGGHQLLKEELCMEAIRLTELLLKSKSFTDLSDVHALLALMYFNSSRFQTRADAMGELLELSQQDRSQWNMQLIQLGLQHLDKIQESKQLSFYKIAATIAAHHSTSPDFAATPWQEILNLYDILLQVDGSPLIQINRAVAVSQVRGYTEALKALLLVEKERVSDYHYYYAVLGEFYLKLARFDLAEEHLNKALTLASSGPEKNYLARKMESCKKLAKKPVPKGPGHLS